MPYRTYTSAQSSHKHAKVARCTSKRRSFVLRRRTSLPVSAELGGVGAGRPIGIWNIDSMHLDSMFEMTPTYEIALNADAVSDFQTRAATFALGGRRAKLGEPGSKRNRRESGTFEWREFVLRRHRPALVTFVRVRVVGTWQERFNLLFEHIMPQHNNSAPAHTWRIRIA
jgi:hypothetical protein